MSVDTVIRSSLASKITGQGKLRDRGEAYWGPNSYVHVADIQGNLFNIRSLSFNSKTGLNAYRQTSITVLDTRLGYIRIRMNLKFLEMAPVRCEFLPGASYSGELMEAEF